MCLGIMFGIPKIPAQRWLCDDHMKEYTKCYFHHINGPDGGNKLIHYLMAPKLIRFVSVGYITMQCICCFGAIGVVPELGTPDGGVECYTHGNYGSAVFEPIMKPEKLVFAVCDSCLKDRLNRNILKKVSTQVEDALERGLQYELAMLSYRQYQISIPLKNIISERQRIYREKSYKLDLAAAMREAKSRGEKFVPCPLPEFCD